MRKENFTRLIYAASILGAGVVHLMKNSEIPAVTLPITREGVVLYLDTPSAEIVKHEKVHQQQIKRLGPVRFIFEYIRHPCDLELEAGADLAHPVCKWEKAVYGNIFFNSKRVSFVNMKGKPGRQLLLKRKGRESKKRTAVTVYNSTRPKIRVNRRGR